MTAAKELIDTAIHKLNDLRGASDPAQFVITDEGRYRYLGALSVVTSVDPTTIPEAEAGLIVTLYQTVDAQLAVLSEGAQAIRDRDALTDSYQWDDSDWARNTMAEMTAYSFARAILGGDTE